MHRRSGTSFAAQVAIAAMALVPVGAYAAGNTAGEPMQQRCAALGGKTLGFGTVNEVGHVEKGAETLDETRRRFVKAVLGVDMPPLPASRSYCRVLARLSPVAGSVIKIEAWLPDQWNRKLLAIGGGGLNGGLFSAALGMREGSAKGYATVVTDLGHDTTESAKFAHDNHEALIDFGYRANHSNAVFVRQLIDAYYGRGPKKAYFVGGSDGGREAMMEARRFPDDYDGIAAGQPAMGFTKLMTAFLWNAQAIESAPGLKDKIGLVRRAVLAKCDSLDGVTDEVIQNPPSCPFDARELQCAEADAADCLTPAEVAALHRIHSGPQLRDGTSIYPGLATGSEAHPSEMTFWLLGEKGLQGSMGQEFFRWMVYGDAAWDRSRFDVDRDHFEAARLAPVLDSDDPDLGAFLKRGGKLLIHHGWNDNAIPPGATLDYYRDLRGKFGAAAERQVRLFLIPGMGHGTGRPAPEHYDVLDALERWVEHGDAPSELVGRIFAVPPPALTGPLPGAPVARTVLLCAWPKVATYKGSGSPDDHANFSCR